MNVDYIVHVGIVLENKHIYQGMTQLIGASEAKFSHKAIDPQVDNKTQLIATSIYCLAINSSNYHRITSYIHLRVKLV